MALLIDTSVLVDAERGGQPLGWVNDEDHLISVITVSELVHGIHRAVGDVNRLRRQAFVERLLAAFEPLPVSVEVARMHADIWSRLEMAGEIIGAHDLWIAATALAHGLRVATTNVKDFERVPGLEVLAVRGA